MAPPREKRENEPPEPNPKTDAAPSRPDIVEVHNGPEATPITVDKVPGTERLQLQVNVDSHLLAEAKLLRPPEEAGAVEFVFKYGLALIAMGLLDAAKKTTEWSTNEVECRERISKSAAGVGARYRAAVPDFAEKAAEGRIAACLAGPPADLRWISTTSCCPASRRADRCTSAGPARCAIAGRLARPCSTGRNIFRQAGLFHSFEVARQLPVWLRERDHLHDDRAPSASAATDDIVARMLSK